VKKTILLTSLACLLFSTAAFGYVRNNWRAGGGTTDYHNAANWQVGVEPNAANTTGDFAYMGPTSGIPDHNIYVTKDVTVPQIGMRAYVGDDAVNLHITNGATFEVTSAASYIGSLPGGDAKLTIDAGATFYNSSTGAIVMGHNADSWVNVYGTFICNGILRISNAYISGGGDAHFNIFDGGVAVCNGTAINSTSSDPAIREINFEEGATLAWKGENKTAILDMLAGTSADGLVINVEDPLSDVRAYAKVEEGVDYLGNGGSYTVLTIFMPDANLPWNLAPADASIFQIDETIDLSWTPGDNATQTIVYIGLEQGDVVDANETNLPASVTRVVLPLATTTINVADYISYEMGDVICWKVASDNGGGEVFYSDTMSINILNHIVIDDFDDYADGDAVRAAWESAWAGDIYNGINLIDLNTDAAYAANGNSMAITYNTVDFYDPFYYGLAIDSADANFLDFNAKSLSIKFVGLTDNFLQKLSVILDDGTNSVEVAYPDSNDLASDRVVVWNIDFADFAGVDLTSVDTLTIQVSSNGVSQPTGDLDTLYIDEVRLYPARCISEFGPAADFDGDCVVDLDDIGVMQQYWLDSDHNEAVTTPSDAILYYSFDVADRDDINALNTGSLTGYKLEPTADRWDAAGKVGECAVFDGVNGSGMDMVDANIAFAGVNEEVSVAYWSYGGTTQPASGHPFKGTDKSSGEGILKANTPWVNPDGQCVILFESGVGPNVSGILTYQRWYGPDGDSVPVSLVKGAWTHWTFTHNAVTGNQKIYCNGELVMTQPGNYCPLHFGEYNIEMFTVGAAPHLTIPGGNIGYDGKIDEFYVFDRELSAGEVAGLAGLSGEVNVPLTAPKDPVEDAKIDIKDFGALADSWLYEQLWPQE